MIDLAFPLLFGAAGVLAIVSIVVAALRTRREIDENTLCAKGRHRWAKWRIPAGFVYNQERHCRRCGYRERRPVPLNLP